MPLCSLVRMNPPIGSNISVLERVRVREFRVMLLVFGVRAVLVKLKSTE